MQEDKRYRLYLDESGDHTFSNKCDIGKRYLGLVGVMFESHTGHQQFAQKLEEFKRHHLPYDPDDPPILHREDIVSRSGPFYVLQNGELRMAFDDDFMELTRNASFRVFCVVLDKQDHAKRSYRQLKHPYHYCLHVVMERYCGYLLRRGARGDIVAEARGASEDMKLKEEYANIWKKGTRFMKAADFQKALTTKELKIKTKDRNIAGLQLADLLAHPLVRDTLVAYNRLEHHGGEIARVLGQICEKDKYDRHYNGRINGYGRVIL